MTQSQRAPAAAPTATPRAAPTAPARLSVAVSDDKGPLADATVRIAPKDGEVVVITTGRDGVAHADHLEPGTWRISAAAADHVPAALAAHTLAAGADDRVAIQLAAGGRPLTGTITDATGGPVAGARIDAARLGRLAEPGDAVATAVSGGDGKYRMTVAEGPALVAVSSADYAPQARRIEVGPAGAMADFALVPGGVIEGIVRDERSREPIAGANVLARRGPAMLLAETGAHRVVSGGDGRFRITGLRPGAWELAASERARRSKHQTIVGLGVAEQVGNLELLIGAGPVIRGRAVDDTGAPAPDVEIEARGRGDAGGSARSDAAGGFALEGLRPGEYSITGQGDAYLGGGTVRVALVDTDVDGIVVTVKRGVTIAGHVEPRQACDVQQDASDQPGLVMLLPSTTTGPDGEFRLGPSREGPARITARCPGGDQGDAQVTVSPGMAEVIVTVAPGASIAGRVRDGDGKPVAGIIVLANEVSHGERTTIRNGAITSGAQALTDAAGAYRLVGLAAGSYRVGALDGGRPVHLRTSPPGVELASREHKTGIDLAIDRPNGVIAGTVVGPDGKPLADAWVSAQPDLFAMLAGDHGGGGPGGAGGPQTRMMVVEDGEGGSGGPTAETSFPPALTDAQGHYAIRGLPPASYTVTAEAQRGQLRARTGDVRPDATVDLKVVAVTALSGTVTGPAGPPALFSVELDGPTRTQRSFTGGSFAFDRVDPGAYTVRVSSSDGNGEATVNVIADTPASVAITLAANAVAIGRLIDPSGKPLAGLPVALVPDTGDGRVQIQLDGPPLTTGSDGSFRLEHRAGPCLLIVVRAPRPFVKRGVALTAGRTVDLGAITVDALPAPPGPGSGGPPPGPGSGASPPRPPPLPPA